MLYIQKLITTISDINLNRMRSYLNHRRTIRCRQIARDRIEIARLVSVKLGVV